MSVKELKTRGRSLLARFLIFSLLLGVLFYREIQPMVAEAATETGESLTVTYNGAVVGQTYQRHYIDEAAGTKEETVTVTVPDSTDLGEGQKLIVWNVDGSKVLPGESIELNWSDLVATASSAALHVSADILSYNTMTNEGWDIGEPTVNYSKETDTYTVTMPGAPAMPEGYRFVRWKTYIDTSTHYAEAGGTITSKTGETAVLSGSQSLSFTAEYKRVATVTYYGEEGTFLEETYEEIAGQNGEVLLISVASAPSSSENKVFTSWKCTTNGEYVLPGDTVTFYDWDSTESGMVYFSPTWLTYDFASNPGWVPLNIDSLFTINATDAGYTITAPDAPKADEYFFENWDISMGEVTETVDAGQTMSYTFSHADDQSILLEAQWVEKKSAQITYDLNGGIYVADGISYDEIYSTMMYQKDESQTEQKVNLIGAPTKDGYVFAGWKYSGEADEYIYDAGATTDIAFPFNEDGTGPTFVAQWTQGVTVRYINDAGVSLLPDVTITPQSETEETFSITVAAGVDNAEGEAFLAWTGAVGEQEYYRPGDTITLSWAEASDYSEIMFLPCWLKGNTYEEGASVSLSIIHGETLEDGFQVSISGTAPTKEGYFFTGWENPYGGVNASGIITDGDGNPMTLKYSEYADAGIDFTAKYEEAKTAQIVFYLNDGSLNNSTEDITTTITQQSAEETTYYVTMPGEPEREGYFFNYWKCEYAGAEYTYAAGESTLKDNLSFSFDGDVPGFNAKWLEMKSAIVTFELSGGTYNGSAENVVQTIIQATKDETGYVITTLSAPEKEGYVFYGWEINVNGMAYTIVEGGTTEAFGLTYAGYPTLTLTALWTEEAEITPTPSVTVTPTPTETPIPEPTEIPESDPAVTPTVAPNVTPTAVPTLAPSVIPTVVPTQMPSVIPTVAPTSVPSVTPTTVPSATPSLRPTIMPTAAPTIVPSATPTQVPTVTPSPTPAVVPTVAPSPTPTVVPTIAPSPTPTATPSVTPTVAPSPEPTATPSPAPESKEVITISAGEMKLEAGQKYSFAAGKWKVNGDSTVYEGGMEFYVGATGIYVISEGE